VLLHTVSLATTQVVGCAADSSDSLDLAIKAQQQGAHLVILCTTPPSPAAAGTPDAVAAELQQLQQAHDKVAQLGMRQLTVYAAVPEASAGMPMQRQLRSVQADVGTCGQLCQVSGSLLLGWCQSIAQRLSTCLVLLSLRSGAAKCLLACPRLYWMNCTNRSGGLSWQTVVVLRSGMTGRMHCSALIQLLCWVVDVLVLPADPSQVA
jgi:hypothetical protein